MGSDERAKTILIMDDSRVVLETVRAALEDTGFVVRAAQTVREFDRHFAAGEPDLIILDVQMPEAFGDDMGRILLQVRKVKAPILLFSCVDEPALALAAKDSGVDGYVSKSSGVQALVARVVALLG